MRKRYILIALVIAISSVGYLANTAEYQIAKRKNNVIWPLALGNKWVYRGYQSPKYYIEVTGAKEIKKQRVFVVRVSSEIELYYQHFLNMGKGLYSYGVIGKQNFIDYGMFDAPILGFKYPGFKGESYKGMKGEKMTIMSTDEKVSTPAGNFVCYEYLNERPNGDFAAVWLSPNVGMVKEVGCVIINGVNYYYKLLLESYRIN